LQFAGKKKEKNHQSLQLGQRTYYHRLTALLLLQFFHVTRRFFEKFQKKKKEKNRGTALLVFVLVLKIEKRNQNQIGRLFCFFRK